MNSVEVRESQTLYGPVAMGECDESAREQYSQHLKSIAAMERKRVVRLWVQVNAIDVIAGPSIPLAGAALAAEEIEYLLAHAAASAAWRPRVDLGAPVRRASIDSDTPPSSAAARAFSPFSPRARASESSMTSGRASGLKEPPVLSVFFVRPLTVLMSAPVMSAICLFENRCHSPRATIASASPCLSS